MDINETNNNINQTNINICSDNKSNTEINNWLNLFEKLRIFVEKKRKVP